MRGPVIFMFIFYTGRAPEQVDEFLEEVIDPVLLKYKDELSSIKVTELNV